MLSLAYAFGLVSQDEFLFVRIIKKVRDLAAHSLTIRGGEEFRFASEEVRKLLREFYPRVMREQVLKEARQLVESTYEEFLNFDGSFSVSAYV
jgi:hypothetical protein